MPTLIVVTTDAADAKTYGWSVGRADGTVWQPSTKTWVPSATATGTVRPLTRLGGAQAGVQLGWDPDASEAPGTVYYVHDGSKVIDAQPARGTATASVSIAFAGSSS